MKQVDSISKDIKDLKNSTKQHDVIGIYRKHHSKRPKCTFFSTVHGTLFDQSGIKLGIYNYKIFQKSLCIWN